MAESHCFQMVVCVCVCVWRVCACDAWWSIGLCWLTAKPKLAESESAKSKMLVFCIMLIFALIFITFDRYLLDIR